LLTLRWTLGGGVGYHDGGFGGCHADRRDSIVKERSSAVEFGIQPQSILVASILVASILVASILVASILVASILVASILVASILTPSDVARARVW